MKLKAVLLLSGGLDSAANLMLGAQSDPSFEVAKTLTIDYGQRSSKKETDTAKALASYFNVDHKVFHLKEFTDLINVSQNGSALFLESLKALPQPRSLTNLVETARTAAAVWVPNRNAVFASLAAAYAEGHGLDAIAFGFNSEEAQTFPDNSLNFMRSLEQTFVFSTIRSIKVVSATARLSKTQIVQKLKSIGNFPFEKIWSCYENSNFHCGRCESCQRLSRALLRGLPEADFTKFSQQIFGL